VLVLGQFEDVLQARVRVQVLLSLLVDVLGQGRRRGSLEKGIWRLLLELFLL